MPEAVIVATGRTPIGRANKGSLVTCRPDNLTAHVVKEVLAKIPQLDPNTIEDLAAGDETGPLVEVERRCAGIAPEESAAVGGDVGDQEIEDCGTEAPTTCRLPGGHAPEPPTVEAVRLPGRGLG